MAIGKSKKIQYLKGAKGYIFLSSDKEMTSKNDYVSGYITKVSYRDSEFTSDGKTIKNRSLSINLKDGDETYNLQFNVKSRGYKTLAGQLLNVNLGKKVEFNSKGRELPTKDENGKPNIATDFYITQGGGVSSAFSKENGRYTLPQWVEHTINGDKVFDKTEFLAKIEEIVTEEIISKLPDEQGNDNEDQNVPSEEPEDPQVSDNEPDDDDLPF